MLEVRPIERCHRLTQDLTYCGGQKNGLISGKNECHTCKSGWQLRDQIVYNSTKGMLFVEDGLEDSVFGYDADRLVFVADRSSQMEQNNIDQHPAPCLRLMGRLLISIHYCTRKGMNARTETHAQGSEM